MRSSPIRFNKLDIDYEKGYGWRIFHNQVFIAEFQDRSLACDYARLVSRRVHLRDEQGTLLLIKPQRGE